MYGLLAGVVHLVCYAGEVGVDAGKLEVVVHLVEKIAQGRGVPVARTNQARQ